MEVVLGMLFPTFSNVDVQFAKKELTCRISTIEKAISTICWFELIN